MRGRPLVRLGRGSVSLREAWFYDPTYLEGDGDLALFVHYFVEYRTRSERIVRRKGSSVWFYSTEEQMVEEIERLGMREGDRDVTKDWVPDEFAGATS